MAIIKGNGLLWSPKAKKVVARRELETNDSAIIELAVKAGWEVIGDTVAPEEEKPKRTRAKKAQDDAE